MDPELSPPASSQKADNSAMWMLENLLSLSGTTEELSFFENGWPASELGLIVYQRGQAKLSTGAGGFGLSSAEARKIPGSVGRMVATVLEILSDLSGAIEAKVRTGLPGSDLVRRIRNSVQDLRDVNGVPEEAMANIVPESWPRQRLPSRGARGLMAVDYGNVASTRHQNGKPLQSSVQIGESGESGNL